MNPRSKRTLGLVALAVASSGIYALACGGSSDATKEPSTPIGGGPGADGGASGDGGPSGPAPVVTGTPGNVAPPEAGDAKPAAVPAGITLPPAPAFSEPVKVVPNRSSVTVYAPYVAGASDYRVFALINGVKVDVTGSGGEDVSGATITCAGLRQHNLCDESEAITDYGQGKGPFDVPKCGANDTPVQKTVLRNIEVNKLAGATVVAVEAIDALCPFPGVYGKTHVDVPVADDPQEGATRPAVVKGKAVRLQLWPKTFPIVTEAEIRTKYKSLILNGHGWIPRSSDPMVSPFVNVGQQAPPNSPKVLARAVVEITPTGTAALPSGFTSNDIFDDFSDETDQPKLVMEDKGAGPRFFPPDWQVTYSKLFQTSKWNIYSYGAFPTQLFVAQGQLMSVLADSGQGVFSSNVLYPKRSMHLPTDDTKFLHVTFEIPSGATLRRYFVLEFCGAAAAGQTYAGDRLPLESGILPAPGFMDPGGGAALSSKGWNCIHIVPRDGLFLKLQGASPEVAKSGVARPESDMRVIVVRPTPPGVAPLQDKDSINLIAPSQFPNQPQATEGAWYRTWGNEKKINGPLLDDVIFATQRTKFDVFVNRGRMVLYANGQQKFCNDIPDALRLTMAEAAVGVGHVLYHSSAEFYEMLDPNWIRSGSYYYRHDTPFVDARGMDSVGMRENASLPAGFQAGPCYKRP